MLGVTDNTDDFSPGLRPVRDVDPLADRVFVRKESCRKGFADDGHMGCTRGILFSYKREIAI